MIEVRVAGSDPRFVRLALLAFAKWGLFISPYFPLITNTGPSTATGLSSVEGTDDFSMAAISCKLWRRAARLAGRCSWAVWEVLLIGVASGCDWQRTLSARPSNGFGDAACPGKIFFGGKIVKNGQRKVLSVFRGFFAFCVLGVTRTGPGHGIRGTALAPVPLSFRYR